MSRILIIDLTDKSIKEEAVPTGRYGRGLAMELIRRHSKEGCERLSPDNTFVVVPGLLTGCHVPCATRATVAARSDNGFAVTSITGDMPQKLASLGISGLVIKGRYECGRCAVYMDGDAVRIFPVPGMDGLTCGDIVENIRKKYGSDCAVIGTGPAGDMRLPLSGLFTTYPEGTPRFTCPRSSFGDVPGSKNLRAVIVKCNKYFGAECADEERLIRDGKALARLIIDDPICGGALPGQKACQPWRALQAVGPESAGAVAAKDRVVKIVYVHGGAPLQADDLGVEKDLQRRDLDEQRQNEYGGQYDHVHQQPFLPVKLLRLLHGGILVEGKMKVKTEQPAQEGDHQQQLDHVVQQEIVCFLLGKQAHFGQFQTCAAHSIFPPMQ